MSPINTQPPLPLARRGSINTRGHSRMNTSPELANFNRPSPPPITASIDETIHENQQVVILEADPNPPMILPELQHLSSPPPPPPPPLFSHSPKSSLGVINIAIDENSASLRDAQSKSPIGEATSPSSHHRRGRGSVSENLGMTFRKVTDRMRSTSRSRNKSPPMSHEPAPYETLPQFSFPRSASARSPVDGMNQFGTLPISQVTSPVEQPEGAEGENIPFYRHPKEIRANMPPEQLQQGVYQKPESVPMV